MADLSQRISNALGVPVGGLAELHGGCIARVVGGTAERRGAFVAKLGDGTSDLTVEAAMLADLGRLSSLPVPSVWHASPDLLVMERLPGSTGVDANAQRHLAELLAALHGIEGPSFGYERDTLIGPLTQPNNQEDSWARFFARHRVLRFAQLADGRGALPPGGMETAQELADSIENEPDRFIAPGERPVLIHGDLWSGNMLSEGGRVTGLIDPAISYADREIELAFMGFVRMRRPQVLRAIPRASADLAGLLRASAGDVPGVPAAGPRDPVREWVWAAGGRRDAAGALSLSSSRFD